MPLKCISSQWPISVASDSYVHQYDVDMEFGPLEKLGQSYQNRPPKDVQMLTKSKYCNLKDVCRHIIDGLDELNDVTYVYNDRAILLTNKVLEHDIDKVMPQHVLDTFVKKYLTNERAVLKIVITKARTINLKDFPTDAAVTLNEDRTWRSAIEMILSNYALTLSLDQYISIGPGLMCEIKSNPFDYGLRYHDGNQKGVEVVQSSQNGRPQLCLSLDFRRKVLLPGGMKFLQLIKNFVGTNGYDYHEAEMLFRNVKLSPCYQPDRILFFKNFTEQSVRDLKVNDISLEQFYRRRNITLQHLNEPAANMINGRGDFPLELLEVLPNQSIPFFRMPKKLKQKAVELNRIEPRSRLGHIRRQYDKLLMNNLISAAFGISIDSRMTEGEYNRLPRMKIILCDNKTVVSNDEGSFKFDQSKYYKAAGYDKIVVFSTQRDQQKSMQSAKKIVEEARKKGMKMPNPIFKEFNTYSCELREWTNALDEYNDGRSKTLVLVVDSNLESHPILKLSQTLKGVQTQHLKDHTASKVANGRAQTLENIVHKLNIKAGGINHLVDFGPNLKKLDLNKTLIIAMDVCHPTGGQCCYEGDEPSTVGLVGNYLPNSNEFAGLFFFQQPRQESVDSGCLQIYVKKMIQQASKYRTIKNIVIIRDGIGEGQYAMFRDQEIAAIEQTTTDLSMKGVKILAIIATKDGITRHFMDVSKGTTASMPPRSFISFGCRFGFNQFYMIAHNSFCGTAKTVMITVIRDDLALSTPELQTFLLGLTHLHQIISSPISLPAPLYQADILAEHGQKCFQTLKRFAERDIPLTPNMKIDYMKLSNLLNFNTNGDLPLTRYTA